MSEYTKGEGMEIGTIRECPFCGGKVVVFPYKDESGISFKVKCIDEDCSSFSHWTTEKQAIKAWNTRENNVDDKLLAACKEAEAFITHPEKFSAIAAKNVVFALQQALKSTEEVE